MSDRDFDRLTRKIFEAAKGRKIIILFSSGSREDVFERILRILVKNLT
ncbi:MAG: hypothetical protein QXW66_01215 [Archaeoglobaceae archaeon]